MQHFAGRPSSLDSKANKSEIMFNTIAVTGATGFVGAALVRRLACTGRRIRALARPGSARKRTKDIAVTWIDGDLADTESLRRLIAGADAVVHCAGAVRGATQAQFDRVNVDGTAHLVQVTASRNPPPRFLLVSSLAAREPHLSHYAGSKRQGETIVAEYSKRFFWGIFRPCALYGPGDRELLPMFKLMQRGIAPVIGAGNGRFSLLYVEDLAEAVVCWLDRECVSGRIYELHDGRPAGYSWQNVIDTFAELRRGGSPSAFKIPEGVVKLTARLNLIYAHIMGSAPMLTPGKVRELMHSNWVCDNTALHAATGWIPRVLLAEGLRRTLNWQNT